MKPLLLPVLISTILVVPEVHAKAGVEFQQDTVPQTILIINSFDAMSMDGRKKKKELFAQLADSLKQLLYRRIEPNYQNGVTILNGLLPQNANYDSAVLSMMTDTASTMAITIKDLDIYFDQTGMEVSGEKGDKSRKVSYDICSNITYALYNSEGKLTESVIKFCEPYSERNSLSSVITFGPDIVSKRKDAFKILATNVEKLFLSADLPLSSRNGNRVRWKIKSADTLLKYSLCFADQAQLLYNGATLKNRINQSLAESGDVSYYHGRYFNSRVRYQYALMELPMSESVSDSGFSYFMSRTMDTSRQSLDYIRVKTRIINSVGLLYQTRGKFVQAEQLLNWALEKRKNILGRSSPEYVNSLHNIAVLKKDLGYYEEADSIFNLLIPLFKELFSTQSIQYVALLNNRAMLLAELGRNKEASQLLDEALSLGATVLSPDYFDYERILTNKALLEQESGNLNNAEQYYQQAISNMEKKKADDHPDYNNIMVYYASLRVQKNDPQVLDFLTKVVDKVKKRYKENHPLTARALTNIGDYYLNSKSYAAARDIYNQVLTIQLNVLGNNHKDYLNTLIKMAICEWSSGDKGNAAIHFNEATQKYLLMLNKIFPSMSESEKTIFWRTLKPNIDAYMSFAMENGPSQPSLLTDAYNLQLKTKGILINATRQTRNSILNSTDTVIRRLYGEWLELKSTLASYYSSPLEDLKDDHIRLDDLEEKANKLEKELSSRSARFSAVYKPAEISYEDLRNKLNPDEAAIEIIRVFNYYGQHKGEAEYFGLVAKKEDASPSLVKLGNSDDLEKKFLTIYKKSILNKVKDTQSYRNYWQALEASLGKRTTIYVSVDGVYNTINLNTLQRKDGKFILDEYNIVLVPNTQSVVLGMKSTSSMSMGESEAVLLGSPIYGNDALIPPLPGTKEEIRRIDTILVRDHVKTKVLIEQSASEENIKSANHPSILHIATHGFFNPNADLSRNMNMGITVSRAKENALLRSGLLFNGAAAVYSDEPNMEGSNNGVLYAYEAMNLDLQGTRLVVLSACETGIGEIVNGEGVYGLSRSFQVAGADKILMSLWKVDDETTRQLMIAFYENWHRLNDPQKAFIQAQQTLKKKYPQPYYWGGFILLN